jgi:hypothetical protein
MHDTASSARSEPAPVRKVAVPCVDVLGRTQLSISTSGGRIVLHTPPGEVAAIAPHEISALTGAINALARGLTAEAPDEPDPTAGL